MTMTMDRLGDKLINRFFKRVDGVVWDLMSGRIGIQGREGIHTIEGEGENAQVSQNLIDSFGLPIPAFAQATPVDQVKVNDLIYIDGKPRGWVIEVKETEAEEGTPSKRRFRVMSIDGIASTWTPPKISMLGLDSGVMVLKSLGEMLPGGEAGLSGLQGSLMPLLMMGGGDGNMDKIMPLLLMSQMGIGGVGAGAGANNMIQMMMLMKLMGNDGGSDFGGNFFDSRR